MGRKIKNVVEFTEVTENVTVETTENLEVVMDETAVKEITTEVAETVEPVEQAENVVPVENENPVLTRERRSGGSGSVYPINNGKNWGFCIQFSNASKEQKKQFGNKLRYLKTFKTYSDACAGVEIAIQNIDELLKQKLEKQGWIEPVAETVKMVENKEVVENTKNK